MVTVRQKIAAQKLAENGGKSIGKAMRDAGYSPETANTPSKLTTSKGWKELMDKYFPDSLLAKKHLALLNKKEKIAIGKSGEREIIDTGELDPTAVARGLDMAYKLKGRYAPDKIAVGTLAEFEEMSDEELKDAASIDNDNDNQEESAGDTSVQTEV